MSYKIYNKTYKNIDTYRESKRKTARNYMKKHPEKRYLKNKNYMKNNLTSWEGYIPKIAQCQMCGKDIFFNTNDVKNAITFDHRHSGTEVIKSSPTAWLRMHKRNLTNEAIWESCDFGMLCHRCNIMLPTSDRQLYLVNVTKYIQGAVAPETKKEEKSEAGNL